MKTYNVELTPEEEQEQAYEEDLEDLNRQGAETMAAAQL